MQKHCNLTSHRKGLTELWMCVCCLSPELVAKVLPHSGQAWQRAPTWLVRMWRCRLEGSVKTLSQFSQGKRRNSPCTVLWRSRLGRHAKDLEQWSHVYWFGL